MSDKIDVAFTALEEWLEWSRAHGYVHDQELVGQIGNRIRANGFVEPLTGIRVQPEKVAYAGGSWREGLGFQGRNSRCRAVLKVLAEATAGDRNRKIYAPEAVTPFAMVLRGRFPYYIGSEYTTDEALKRDMFPIPLEDLTELSFPTGVFDIVSTNEVLEHVDDLDASLREMCRVLKPGGSHIGTVPFAFGQHESVVFSRIVDGELVHLREPEYHGDPFGKQGSLVFEIPAWDILDRALAAGFSEACMRFIFDEAAGIMSDNTGIFVLCLKK